MLARIVLCGRRPLGDYPSDVSLGEYAPMYTGAAHVACRIMLRVVGLVWGSTMIDVRAICRGEGCGYVALTSKSDVDGLRARACTSKGAEVPCSLFCVDVPSERRLLAPDGSFAWIVVIPLLGCSCVITLERDGMQLKQLVFSERMSKLRSRALTYRSPAVAGLLRGFEQRRGAGRSLLFIREVWPAYGGTVAWRLQTEFPTDDATAPAKLVIYDQQANPVGATVVCMEDHVVPFGRDAALPVRIVTFSCVLPESLGNFYAVASLGDACELEAFAAMNAPRAQGMLADVRRFTAGASTNGWYEGWHADTRATRAELERERCEAAALREGEAPLFSLVLPVAMADAGAAQATVASVLAQSYERWELFVIAYGECADVLDEPLGVSDGRVRARVLPDSTIVEATNVGIDAMCGDFVAVIDAGDTLEPDALWWYTKEVRADKAVDVLYCDEDRVRDGQVCEPEFKTFPNYGSLYTRNYVKHLLAMSASVVATIELPTEDVSGAQAYDLALKAFEVAHKVSHVPRVLYHARWRDETAPDAEARATIHEAGRRALAAHLARRGIRGRVEDGPSPQTYRVRYELPSPAPCVSIVIPTRDHADLLGTCVQSILQKSTYANYEIVLVENGSEEAATFEAYAELCKDSRVRVVHWKPGDEGFNYSALINFGVAHSEGECVVLLNNDTEVIEPAWLEEMLGCLMRPEVGVVGAKLLFYDGLIQHVGMVANPAGDNCHVCQNLTRDALGPSFAAAMPGDYSMVTGACQMTRRAIFEELGGYDENLAVGFNDGDFCLRAGEAGYAVTMAAHALLYHREFSTRGREITDKRLQTRFLRERAYIMGRHPEFYAQGDPALNPNLNGFSAYFDL